MTHLTDASQPTSGTPPNPGAVEQHKANFNHD
jgi:hypothetical protein